MVAIFFGEKNGQNVPKWPQKYQIAVKYTKIAMKIPNETGHEAHQIFPFQGLPKLVIFGLKIYHLATLELRRTYIALRSS
jgi:hypothetical protein